MPYSVEVKETAKRLYLRRCRPREIQAQLGLPNVRIVYYWIARGGWDEMLTDEEPLTAVSRRITLLLEKVGSLSKGDLDELDRLTSVRERLVKQAARPAPVEAAGARQDSRGAVARRAARPGRAWRTERGQAAAEEAEERHQRADRAGFRGEVHQQDVRLPAGAIRGEEKPADRADPQRPQKQTDRPDPTTSPPRPSWTRC